ncbi:hypothetical protein ACYSNR_06910 [Enterococcus sp. LJL128]
MINNNLWDKKINYSDSEIFESSITFNLKQLEQLFTMKIECIYGCFTLVYGEENEEPDNSEDVLSNEEFNRFMKKMFTDEIGYEFANTELRIIDFIDQELTIAQQYQLGKIYIHCLNARLTLMTNRKINYFMGFDDDILTIRFYQEWESSVTHFDHLENFSDPVAIISSEEISNGFVQIPKS